MKLVGICLILFSLNTYGVSAFQTQCPVQFVGTILDIFEEEGASHSLSRLKLLVKKIQILKGTIQEESFIQVLKFGPWDFKSGESYKFSLNNGKICHIEPTSKDK